MDNQDTKQVHHAQMSAEQKLQEAALRQESREKRKRRRRVLYGVWLMLLAVVIYIGVQVVLVLTPTIRRETAIKASMTDSIMAPGFVALESEPIYTEGGTLYFTVESGERVSSGTAVAQIYQNQNGAEARARIEELDAEIERLDSAIRTNSMSGDTENYSNQLHGHISTMLDAVDSGDYTRVEEPAGEAELAANKLQLATGDEAEPYHARLEALRHQREQYESAAAPSGELVAPATGYFVQASGSDRVPMAYETLAGMDANALQGLADVNPDYYGANVAGYIISDYKWSFFALVSAEEAGRFVEGDKKLTIGFAELGSSLLPVTVQSVELAEGENVAKIELYCEYMSPEILKMQSQTVEIVFSEQDGVRISKEALRVYEGEEGVFIVFGNVVYFRRVEIILEDDFYILVPLTTSNTVNSVKLYDEIITDSGGVELYDGKIL